MTRSFTQTALAMLCVGLWLPAAGAATITFVTPTGATTGGGPVNAQAVFTTSANTLTIVLTNLQSNPTDVAQNLSDLSFNVVGGPSTGTLTSSLGTERTINSDGTFTNGGTVSTGWLLSNTGSLYTLDDLAGGAAGPAHTIIGGPGPGNVYTNANGSIAGNGPHNPFLANSATFTLNLAGITSSTTIDNVTFSFGTVSGVNVPGVVPEPASVVMLGLGFGAVGLMGLRRRTPKTA